MATTRQQSEFCRLFSSGFLVPLILLLLAAQASQAAEEFRAGPSGYQPMGGEEFFLLSETSYGSTETATVRVEVSRNSGVVQEYGGVDIAVYRVPDPIAFLRAQKNLHRIKLPGKGRSEGLANMLSLSWDKIWTNTRFDWRRLFSSSARVATTTVAPELKTPEDIRKGTRLRHPSPYAALPGMKLLDRFRYPVQFAKPVEGPKLARLAGSSSEFMPRNEGNIRVPIGKREPGLYLVEAYIGKHRALGLVFVSDSIAVSKNSAGEMMVWTADRKNGTPAAGSQVVWTDGVGVLKSGRTGADGIARLTGKSPETSYVYGVDAKGGVFISENFYHDSEIYNAKIYAVTDRPLYRPGDLVQVKFLGREFRSSRVSVPVAAGEMTVMIVDPAGTGILTKKLKFDPQKGADFDFRLPASAQSGGWEIIFSKNEDRYGAAFRVSEYVKPHFEIDIVLDKAEFKTGEAVTGKVRLLYPDGKPVREALVRLTARAQPLTMVEGELRYGGQFPLAIKADELKTGSDGVAGFSLPPASDPSRYLLSLLAQDEAAYRVRANKEILIERGATLWQLHATHNFSQPGEAVPFRFTPQGSGTASGRPTKWETLRLEDRKRQEGTLPASGNLVNLPFPEAGSYTVSLRDAAGNLLAATSHWVSGEGMKAVPGSVEIVFDKESYRPGDTAQALITFPHPVANALLTLERDRVEAHALLSGKSDWVSLTRVAPAQWLAGIKVRDAHSPNITFSVLYLANGDYIFQNKGLRVATPGVDVAIRPGKERYAPGERVEMEIETRLDGKPVPAQLTLGVVDEMIYVLQPEIAPTLGQFFYHPRRNNVRTTVSLSFIGYDLARPPDATGAPTRQAPPERAVKVLERPRRDDTDTAGWWPSLTTGADGRVKVSFRMPDALTRWRITARAMTAQGIVGQQSHHVESHKPFYAKWTGPAQFRTGDQPRPTLAVFNQSGKAATIALSVSGSGLSVQENLDLRPGANSVPLSIDKAAEGIVDIVLRQNGREMDRLQQKLVLLPQAWPSQRFKAIELRDEQAVLGLPADAQNVEISLARGSAGHFARITDDLIDYPWGCVEQTASRVLPLALAYRSLPGNAPNSRELYQTLSHQRLRLVQMAGPQAIFGWWGNGTRGSAWLTAYAYYADWHATRALGLKLPDEHWEESLKAYSGQFPRGNESRGRTGSHFRQSGKAEMMADPLPLRVLSVWFMQEMNLPVKTLLEGLVQEANTLEKPGAAATGSVWLGESNHPVGQWQMLVLIGQMAKQNKVTLPAELGGRIAEARQHLLDKPEFLGHALLAMEGRVDKSEAGRWLAEIGPGAATFDRALALSWWSKALGHTGAVDTDLPDLKGDWQLREGGLGNVLGARVWRWNGKTPPASLQLAASPTAPLTAFVRYRSASPEKGRLPVSIERKLYRLHGAGWATPEEKKEAKKPRLNATGEAMEFTLEPVSDGQLRSNELYMEEITLKPAGTPLRFGLLEVPLPPGAGVERGTWGIRLKFGQGEQAKTAGPKHEDEGNGVIPMDRARSQPGELSYAIPVDDLSEPRTIRHLLRFGSRGSFILPPVRFHRMYQPDDKAFENIAERRIRVE